MPLPNLAETLWREARFAVRALAATPMATAVAMLSLAVTIGANTTISHTYWQRQFGGAPDVIGRVVRLNSVPFTIVGVTPPSFFGMDVGRTFDVMAPLGAEAPVRGPDSALDSASTNFLNIVARLKSGQSLDAAAAGLRGVQRQIRKATVGPWSKDVS